jgi:hypothetical protein
LAAFYAFIFTLGVEGEETTLRMAIRIPHELAFWTWFVLPVAACVLIIGRLAPPKSSVVEWWSLGLLFGFFYFFSPRFCE